MGPLLPYEWGQSRSRMDLLNVKHVRPNEKFIASKMLGCIISASVCKVYCISPIIWQKEMHNKLLLKKKQLGQTIHTCIGTKQLISHCSFH